VRVQLLGVYSCVVLSAGFIVVDAAGGGLDRNRPDLAIELFARILMLVLAVLAARGTRGDRQVQLLLWGVICVSFDTYWQTTYRHLGGKPLEWLEMIVKYIAIGLGLGLLLRLCAGFGDESGDRLRATVRRWSLAIGGALTAVGLWHGVLYVQSCYFFYPGRAQCIISEQALVTLDAYLVVDALLRATIIVVAVIGYVRASDGFKQRTLLVASSSVVFALGTVVDFLARLQVTYDVAVVLQVVDAVTTVLFPLGLLYAATRRRLFDVEYAVNKSISYTAATLVVVFLWGATVAFVETLLHHAALAGGSAALVVTAAFSERVRRAGRWAWAGIAARRTRIMLGMAAVLIIAIELSLHHHVVPRLISGLFGVKLNEDGPVFKYGYGFIFLVFWKRIEKIIERGVEHFVSPERAKRRDRLRSVIAKIPFAKSLAKLNDLLNDALHTAFFSTFADVYLRHPGSDRYDPYMSSADREPVPRFFHESQPPVPRLARRRHICLQCKDKGIPEVELMLPMPARGTLFGFISCGPPKRPEVEHFMNDEIAELAHFAATAGNALALHGATPARPPRKERS
jgi:hypothetical protein